MIYITFYLFLIYINLSSSLKLQKNDMFSNWQVGHKSPNGPHAENIKCKTESGDQSFNALITLPSGFVTVPVFHEASNVNPSISEHCIMKQVSAGGIVFAMKIFDLEACGVQMKKGNDNAQWLSVTIRFPYVGGLRMAEDEYITIMCKPQDRTIVKNHVIDLKSTAYNAPKTIFSSAPLDFDCNLELFIKPDGENTFSKRLPDDGVIEMGSEIQLRGSVRSGDGWRYAMVKDVAVHKATAAKAPMKVSITNNGNNKISYQSSLSHTIVESDPYQNTLTSKSSIIPIKSNINRYGTSSDRLVRHERQVPETAFLVFSDGCRNPAFKNVAQQHPYRDSTNSLMVNFNFKAFMFQDMQDGDSIRITAKVIACVDQQDCQPVRCMDDDLNGYGRKKRSINENHKPNNITEDFPRTLLYKVVAPGYATTTVKDIGINEYGLEQVYKRGIDGKCKQVIYSIGFLSLTFSFIVTLTASIALCKSTKRNFK